MESSYIPFIVFTSTMVFLLIVFIVNRNMAEDDKDENTTDSANAGDDYSEEKNDGERQ